MPHDPVGLVAELIQHAISVGRLQAQLELHVHLHEHVPLAAAETETAETGLVPRGRVQRRIVEYLDAHGPTPLPAVYDAIGGNAHSAQQAVTRLIAMGVLERDNDLVKRRHPV